MKISANSVKNGNILLHNNELHKVVTQPEHVKPGKGPAYIQLEMKNLRTGNKISPRVSSSDMLEKVSLDQEEYQFLYDDAEKLYLMQLKNGEQIEVNKEILGDKLPLLEAGITITLESYNSKPLSISLPKEVICEISETEPVIKGATVTSSHKPAILTNGLRVMVPPYIVAGEKILIKTEDTTFIGRVKKDR